jgi:hypothetical protein
MKCYACDNIGQPRDIGGSICYLCDECYGLDIIANKLNLACLQAQLILQKSKEVTHETV